ncbi:hypothetical protein SB6411_05855 [Klebsiella spallanzanii]|uniref:Uncharacterized protein n=1 Tax=Klebsiella spallanzanii TaxID=2587528 RepID=A0ABY6VC74_9ENTR|nr:hypothetical protein SB6411_05855 [Klebsiella spallanzanii]
MFDTLAAIGTAETPAEPISGLIGFLLNLLSSFAISTPAAVPIPNAITPSTRMPSVCGCRNLSATSFAPTDNPRKMVTILISPFCTVSLRRSTTPLSRIRLPKQNIPSSGAASGSSSATSSNSTAGKRIFSRLLTVRSCTMRIFRSLSLVSAFIIGGWINGTSAIYEYAATAMAPSSSGASLPDR